MKTTMRLTLDGLMRALRVRMHRMADEIEAGYAAGRRPRDADAGDRRGARTDDDDVGRD